jgi:hypothetical protein
VTLWLTSDPLVELTTTVYPLAEGSTKLDSASAQHAEPPPGKPEGRPRGVGRSPSVGTYTRAALQVPDLYPRAHNPHKDTSQPGKRGDDPLVLRPIGKGELVTGPLPRAVRPPLGLTMNGSLVASCPCCASSSRLP